MADVLLPPFRTLATPTPSVRISKSNQSEISSNTSTGGASAAKAVSAGQAPPPTPVCLPNYYVLSRTQKVDGFIVTLGDGAVVPPPDPNTLKPSPDPKEKVQEEVSRQAA